MVSNTRENGSARWLAVILSPLVLILGCSSPPPTKPFFDPQDYRRLDKSISVVQQSVPAALASLGLTLGHQVQGQGTVSIDATSPAGLEVTVKLEAMTSKATQVRICVFGNSYYEDWLATQIGDAIQQEAAIQAMATSSVGVVESGS